MIQNINDNPYILEENENFAVVYKPPKMHTEPLGIGNEELGIRNENLLSETIFGWYRACIKENDYLKLLHRLDYETHGLVLFAKNEKSYNFFKDLQDRGGFVKEYSAICSLYDDKSQSSNPTLGFPVSPSLLNNTPITIESYFRPYGKGRKVVRPVIDDQKKHKETAKDKGGFYRTEIININKNIFLLLIKRGFRHQIRCHLCWKGFPILNDPLYPEITETSNFLALRSHALFFIDPVTGENLEYRIEPLS